MPELDFTVRRALDSLAPDVTLPAMYDMLTPEQRRWARGEYARLQGGLCPFCLQPLHADPPPCILRMELSRKMFGENLEFLRWPQHLHHDHRTGLTIGCYHARCNAVLAQYHGE
jgi:hypothetical protein